jgi:hypothetical protein
LPSTLRAPSNLREEVNDDMTCTLVVTQLIRVKKIHETETFIIHKRKHVLLERNIIVPEIQAYLPSLIVKDSHLRSEGTSEPKLGIHSIAIATYVGGQGSTGNQCSCLQASQCYQGCQPNAPEMIMEAKENGAMHQMLQKIESLFKDTCTLKIT